MRCDCCPLCPIADDDVCPESEGKYGIEHADGMWGCKHPRNWVEKKNRELDKCMADTGTDMGIEMSYSKKDYERLISICKIIVGLHAHKPYHRHGKAFYKPSRNRYASEQPGHKLLDKLPSYIITKEPHEPFVRYYLTHEGLEWLGRQLNIEIKE